MPHKIHQNSSGVWRDRCGRYCPVVAVGKDYVQTAELTEVVFLTLGVDSEGEQLQRTVGSTTALLHIPFAFPSVGARHLATDIQHLLCQRFFCPAAACQRFMLIFAHRIRVLTTLTIFSICKNTKFFGLAE